MAYTPGITDTQIRATPLPVSGPLTDAQLRAVAVPVSNASLPLPTGASTSALQTTGNSSLTSLDGKAPALGQALAAASVPVVLTAAQIVTLTPPAALTGFSTSALQTTGNSSLSSVDGKTPALGQALAAASTPVVLTAVQITTLTPPAAITGFSTETTLAALNAKVTAVNTGAVVLAAGAAAIGSVSVTGSVAVTGPLTDTQLRATALPVSLASTTITGTVAAAQSGTWNIGSITTLPALPTGTNSIGAVTRTDTTASGSITAISQSVAIALNGKSGAAIQITGTWVGTLQFEGTVDGTNWVTVNGVYAGTSTPGATTTINGIVRLTPSGLAQLRITSTAWTSGTATISIRASDATGGTFINQSLTAGTNSIGTVILGAGTAAVGSLTAGSAVIGAVTQSGTWNVGSITTLPSLVAGAAVIGAVTQSGTWNVGSITTLPALAAGTNSIGTVQQAALTKGTQGTTGVTTQDLKDAGRVIFSAATVIAGVTAVTTEALLSMVPTRDGVAAAGATTFAVTAGKRLRLTGISVGMISSGASVLSMRFALRINPAGAAAATSPILRILPVPSGAALAQAGGYADIEFTDGIELSGAHQFGITQIGSAITGTCWVSVSGFEY